MTHWLCPDRQVGTVMDKLPFLVLHDLLAKGNEFYFTSELVNLEDTVEPVKPLALLKVRDPWD